MSLTNEQKRLVVAGAVLFLLGLLLGAVNQSFENPRMALSAHLTAVQSGTALMIVGVVWPAVALQPRLAALSGMAIIGGMYGLVAGLTLSAMTGASAVLPIAGAGHSAGAAMETVVTILVLGSSAAMTVGWLLFVMGLVHARADRG